MAGKRNENLPATDQSTEASLQSEPPIDEVAAPISRYFWMVVGLHLSVVVLNIVPLFFYFQRSWQLEHYQFFPIALLIFGYLIYTRIEPGKIRESSMLPWGCAAFLLISMATFVASSLQFNHYLPSVGVFFAIGSLLLCLQDKESESSLLPVWLLLLPLIRIPLNLDITLISELQFFSSAFASNVLDFIGIPNYTPGTVITIAQQGIESGVKRFDVERACSGVQSLYTLIFCTLTVAVWARRSFVAGLFLVMSGVFWSIIMNGLRIVICVSFYYWFDVDVYSGISHDILGYLILFAAIGLIASTDAFLSFLLGPIDVSSDSRNMLARAWNRLVAGVVLFRHRTSEVELTESGRKLVRGSLIGVLGLLNLFAVILLISSVSSGRVTGAFKVGELNMTQADLPALIKGVVTNEDTDPINKSWRLVDGTLQNKTRNSNSTYGPYSSEWLYVESNSNYRTLVSLDYTFLGWHELKICYKGSGWKVDRAVVPNESWQAVELYLSKDNGETGYCIFSIFDYQGNPVEPLSDNFGLLLLRIKNRIAREFSTTTTFQIQCFIQAFDEIPKARIESVRALHLKVREQVRETVLDKINE